MNKDQLISKKGRVILNPVDSIRKGWEKSFQSMAAHKDDALLIAAVYENENLDK